VVTFFNPSPFNKPTDSLFVTVKGLLCVAEKDRRDGGAGRYNNVEKQIRQEAIAEDFGTASCLNLICQMIIV